MASEELPQGEKGITIGVTPYQACESWRERIYKEEEKAYEFWGDQPDAAKDMGMQHALRKPKKPVPLHAHAPKSVAGESFATKGSSTRGSETTAILNDRLARLEDMLAHEKSRREQVEGELIKMSKIRTVNDIW